MKILVIGGGAREHAICWKISQSKHVQEIFCAPGNPGIQQCATCVDIKDSDILGLLEFAKKNIIDFVIVGPEVPLSLAVVDKFLAAGILIFGPKQYPAQLEASKSFCKEVMVAANVPTAKYDVFFNKESALIYAKKLGFPTVLKADGLAAGKGVVIAFSEEETKVALSFVFDELKSEKIVVEQFLKGVETSFIVATDGINFVPMCASNDYKTIFEGNIGLNTGGMGTVSPTEHLPKELEKEVCEKIISPMLLEMQKRGHKFVGFLYAGLMISDNNEINVIEFNARCGDPETEVIMSRMEGDLLELLYSLAFNAYASEIKTEKKSFYRENIEQIISFSHNTAVCVVLASKGYPETSSKGDVILGVDPKNEQIQNFNKEHDIVVFHAGTKFQNENIVTNGGRVLAVTALGNTLEEARAKAFAGVEKISFNGQQYRKDIGLSYFEIEKKKLGK